jgi:mycofactocin precursor
MNIATGKVLHDTSARTPALSAHRSEPARHWLADPKRARWHLHVTPTTASSLRLIEGWFSVLTRKALRDTSFTSAAFTRLSGSYATEARPPFDRSPRQHRMYDTDMTTQPTTAEAENGLETDGQIDDELLADELLVEEISIDGMCGVY